MPEMTKDESWAQYQRERNQYVRGIGPGGPRFMPYPLWKKKRGIVDTPILLQKIEALPALTQARILTELQNDPRQVAHIKSLLAAPDPAAAIIKDQEKVALNTVKPGLYPEAEGKWPVYRQYFRRGYGIAVKRAAMSKKVGVLAGIGIKKKFGWEEIYGLDEKRLSWQSFYGIDGLGAEAQQQAVQAATSIVKGETKKEEDWGLLLKTAQSLATDYGMPALKANVNAYAQKKEGKQEGKLATKAMTQIEKQVAKTTEKETASAVVEQAKVAAEVAPTTNPEPKPGLLEKKGFLIGGGVALAALVGLGLYLGMMK